MLIVRVRKDQCPSVLEATNSKTANLFHCDPFFTKMYTCRVRKNSTLKCATSIHVKSKEKKTRSSPLRQKVLKMSAFFSSNNPGQTQSSSESNQCYFSTQKSIHLRMKLCQENCTTNQLRKIYFRCKKGKKTTLCNP